MDSHPKKETHAYRVDDVNVKVREKAAEILAMCNEHQHDVLLQLVKTLNDDSDPYAAIDAARALGTLGTLGTLGANLHATSSME